MTNPTIDIPIGMPADKPCQCDIKARSILGSRRSSVFPAPVRNAIDANFYDLACNASEEACGEKRSKETYALLSRICDLDCMLRPKPGPGNTVHPGICFYYWNNRQPMRYSKHSGFGFMERFQLVDQSYRGAAEKIRQSPYNPKMYPTTIFLTRWLALWTAQQIHSSDAVCCFKRARKGGE